MTASKPLGRLFALGVCGCVLLSACSREAPRKNKKTRKSPPPTEASSGAAPAAGYLVVQVDQDVRVIRKADLGGLRHELRSEYREAVARYGAEKREAEKSKAAFEKLPPVQRRLRLSRTTFASEEEAGVYRDKLLAKLKSGETKNKRKKAVTGRRTKRATAPPPIPDPPAGAEGETEDRS